MSINNSKVSLIPNEYLERIPGGNKNYKLTHEY